MSLRWRSLFALMVLFAVVLLLASLAGNYAVHSIRNYYGAAFARNQSQLEKQRLVSQLDRELALARRFANMGSTRAWLEHETDPVRRAAFLHDAEAFRQDFASHAYWIAANRSLHYYLVDSAAAAARLQPRYTLHPSDPADAWYFSTCRTVRDYALNVDVDSKVAQTNVWFNVVIRDGGRVIGMAGTGLNLTRFLHDFVASTQTGVTNIIVDGRGAIQADPDARLINYSPVTKVDADKTLANLVQPDERAGLHTTLDELRRKPESVSLLHVTLQGEPRLLAISYIPEIDWYVISAVDLKTASAVDERLLVGGIIAAGALLVAIGLLVMFGLDRMVLTPLAQLNRSVSRIAGGDYGARLASTRNDELGGLARAVDSMAEEISSHTGQLEQRIEERTRALTEANERIVVAHRAIQDSIRYASMIQNSTLPRGRLSACFGDRHFLLWKPRDVVGGDFYVCRVSGSLCLLGVIDCAGHSVPGAFMTLIAQAAFDAAVSRAGLTDPAAVLGQMDAHMRETVGDNGDAHGLATSMDAGLCAIDFARNTMTFAGARLSLWWSDGAQCEEIPGARRSIADRRRSSFHNQVVPLHPARSYYLATDGILDQAGGDRGYGFGRRRFKDLLRRCGVAPMAGQQAIIERGLADYQGTRPQRDDITLLGFQLETARRADPDSILTEEHS